MVFTVLLSGLDPPLTRSLGQHGAALPDADRGHARLAVDRPVRRIGFRTALPWLGVPLVYVAYSLLRGPLVDWYPYPFLDPADGGYGRVAVVSWDRRRGRSFTWLVTRVPARR